MSDGVIKCYGIIFIRNCTKEIIMEVNINGI